MLILKLALRELRGGVRDFRLFIACLIIGVAVIAAVNSVSRQIRAGIAQESRTLLGGDVLLSIINAKATNEQLEFLRGYGAVSLSVNMRTMAIAGDEVTLVDLKGVDEAYPLLGEARLAGGRALQEVLKEGQLVAEEGFVARMLLKSGDTLKLGDASFTLADVLAYEPDRINSQLTLGLRVMGNLSALEAKGLMQPAGLTRFQYHVKLKDGVTTQDFLEAAKAAYPKAPWIAKTVNENNRGVQDFIQRLQLFMTLAGLSTLLIGGIGIMNAAETYLARKAESVAVMKTLGASRAQAFRIYFTVLMMITLAGSLVGAVGGAAASHLALPYLADLLPVFDLRFRLDGYAIALSVLFGVLTVVSFSIPSLSRGVEVRPAVLFRGAEPGRARMPRTHLLGMLACGALLVGLLVLTASDRRIAMGFIASAAVSFAIFAAATRCMQRLARHIKPRAPWAKLAVANLYRPGNHTLSIMLSTGIGLTVLLALLLVESNFQREVKETMPKVAPSLFLIDIQPDQIAPVTALLEKNEAVSQLSSQPMLRGRIATVNGVPVEKLSVAAESRWALESDRGLTTSATPPANSPITDGAWWAPDYRGKPLVSMDRKLARGMGIGVGDRLSVVVLGREVEAEIANLREINYISFQINFALVFSPGALDGMPLTHIATLKTRDAQAEGVIVRQLARAYPNVSAIRIQDSIDQISEMVSHIAVALRLCAVVTVLAGVLVLASAMAAMLDARTYDMVVMKVLGARRADVMRLFLAEWAMLGALTSLLSCGLGMAGAWLILKRLDWVQFSPLPEVIAGTIALSMLCVIGTGLVIHTRVFQARPSSILRNE